MSALIEWLQKRVPEYGRLPQEEKEAIQDFCMIWSLFEGTLLHGNASVPKIRRFVGSMEQGHLDQLNLDAYVGYLRNRYVGAGRFTHHYDDLHLEKSGRPPEVDVMLNAASDSKRDQVIGCLTIVYRLRNNLFHGAKWKYQLQNQLRNFNEANIFLTMLMDLYPPQ